MPRSVEIDITHEVEAPQPRRMTNATWRMMEEYRQTAMETVAECDQEIARWSARQGDEVDAEIARWTIRRQDAAIAAAMCEAGQKGLE